MAQPAWLKKYLTMKPETEKVFDDLEKYLDFCRIELREFNPSHLYNKDNENYRAFVNSQRPRKPYQGNKPRFERRTHG